MILVLFSYAVIAIIVAEFLLYRSTGRRPGESFFWLIPIGIIIAYGLHMQWKPYFENPVLVYSLGCSVPLIAIFGIVRLSRRIPTAGLRHAAVIIPSGIIGAGFLFWAVYLVSWIEGGLK